MGLCDIDIAFSSLSVKSWLSVKGDSNGAIELEEWANVNGCRGKDDKVYWDGIGGSGTVGGGKAGASGRRSLRLVLKTGNAPDIGI